MEYDEDKVDEVTLALLWLTSFKDPGGVRQFTRNECLEGQTVLCARSLISGPFKGVLQQFTSLIDRSVSVIAGLNC